MSEKKKDDIVVKLTTQPMDIPNANGDSYSSFVAQLKDNKTKNFSMESTLGTVKCAIHEEKQERTEEMKKCTHPQVERVVKIINDHSVEEDKWVCVNCGEIVATMKTIASLKEPIYISDSLKMFGQTGKKTPLTTEELYKIFDLLKFQKDLEYIKGCVDNNLVVQADPETEMYTIQTGDADKIKRFLSLGNVFSFLCDFESYLRSEWKHNADGYTEDQYATLEAIRDKFYVFMGEWDINLN